ncbi:cyclic nucleotide-binding domain-containing protein [Solidesulfovibrio sp.]
MPALHYKRFALFDGVPRELVEKIIQAMEPATFAKGQIIYEQDDPAGLFYFLDSGKALLQVGSHDGLLITLGEMKSGFCFGWSSLLPGQKRRHTVVCTETCAVSTIPGETLEALMESQGCQGYALLRNFFHLFKDRLDLRTDQLARMIESHPDLNPPGA